MPFHRPIPDDPSRKKAGGGFSDYVEAEKLMQIALVLPAAVAICGLAGWLADRLLHQHWILIVGIVFGCVSGLYYVVQTAVAAEKASRKGNTIQNGTGNGNPDDPA